MCVRSHPFFKYHLTFSPHLLVQHVLHWGFASLYMVMIKNTTKLKCECRELFLFYSFSEKVM